MELNDAMSSQNACRYYTDEPVPESAFYQAVEYARYAPQGGNRQPVQFLIVTDPEHKRQLAEWYLPPWQAYLSAASEGSESIDASSGDAKATWVGLTNPAKALADANNFAEHFGEHPAIVVVLADIEATHPTDTDLDRLSIVGGASVYPAMQNFCLSLRDQGIATTVTTLLCMSEPQVKELLGIPDYLSTAAFVVAGYPVKPFPTKLHRRPVEDIGFIGSMDRPLRG